MTLDARLGRLTLHPGATPGVACVRPMVGAEMMRRLAEGRRAAMLPELIGSVFTLCAAAQRLTARRAVLAACGLADGEAALEREARQIALAAAREHLQRLALDLPTLVPQADGPADPTWLRDAPVVALPASAGDAAARQAAAALPGWLERQLFGLRLDDWLAGWRRGGDGWLTHWVRSHPHPLTAWLAAVREPARASALPCRTLGLPGEGDAGWRAVAEALAEDDDFATRPVWHGQPAETGPWTRAHRGEPVETLWQRLGARLADLAAIALAPAPLAFGALRTGPGEAIAWTEMSRGLLVHWVRLETDARDPEAARARVYRVIAPTEWNFHPDGALSRALEGRLDPTGARLAAAVLDPCIGFDVTTEHTHA